MASADPPHPGGRIDAIFFRDRASAFRLGTGCGGDAAAEFPARKCPSGWIREWPGEFEPDDTVEQREAPAVPTGGCQPPYPPKVVLFRTVWVS